MHMTRRGDHERVYVVIRVDFDRPPPRDDQDGLGPAIRFDQYSVTPKEIVTTWEEAVREAQRLNELNANKRCRYYCAGSRFFPDGGSFGTEVPFEGDESV